MADYWVTFSEGKGGYVDATDANNAMEIAKDKTGRKPVRAQTLPYPANPIIYQGPGHPKYGPCPPFCYTPEECVGRGSCPKSYACSE